MADFSIREADFEQKVLHSDRRVLVDFWAEWCAPCRRLAPLLSEIAGQHGEIDIARVNVDEEPRLALTYSVSSVPTLIAFENGEPRERLTGLHSRREIEQLLS